MANRRWSVFLLALLLSTPHGAPVAAVDPPDPDNVVDAARLPDTPSWTPANQGLPALDPHDRVIWKSRPQLVDVNLDGFLDLAAHRRLADGPSVWFGDGTGVWSAAATGLDIGAACGGGVEIAHLDGDRHLDLALADHCDGVFTFLGNGRGRWQPATRALNSAAAARIDGADGANPLMGTEHLAVGDVNDDGFADIVAAASNEGGFSVFLGDGSARTWREATGTGLPGGGSGGEARHGGWANEVRLADLDDDGHLDLVASYFAGPRVWRGTGKAHWQEASAGLPSHLLGGLLRGIDVGDVNTDGRADIVVANWVNGPEVFLQTAEGGWQPTADVMPRMRGGAQAVALGDMNGDGRLDLLVGGRLASGTTGFGLFLLIGDGRGGWRQAPQGGLPDTGVATIWGFAVGDVDGDDRLDFAVATGGNLEPAFPRHGLTSAADAGLPLLQVWLSRPAIGSGAGRAAEPLAVDPGPLLDD